MKITPMWKVLQTFSRNFPSAKITMITVVLFGIQNELRRLTDTAMLISELTRFDSFYIFFYRTPRVLVCRQTDKEFRLPWPSFVRVEIYYKYRLSINRKYKLSESWIFHSEVVRASASRTRGHEFETWIIHFPNQGLFFLFPCLSFLFFSISE